LPSGEFQTIPQARGETGLATATQAAWPPISKGSHPKKHLKGLKVSKEREILYIYIFNGKSPEVSKCKPAFAFLQDAGHETS